MSEWGGANCRLKMTIFHFNFKSARGANYKKYGKWHVRPRRYGVLFYKPVIKWPAGDLWSLLWIKSVTISPYFLFCQQQIQTATLNWFVKELSNKVTALLRRQKMFWPTKWLKWNRVLFLIFIKAGYTTSRCSRLMRGNDTGAQGQQWWWTGVVMWVGRGSNDFGQGQ